MAKKRSAGPFGGDRTARSRELAEMKQLLVYAGYPAPAAKKLLAEGIGPEELKQRIRAGHGGPGSLEYTHGIKESKRSPGFAAHKAEMSQRAAERSSITAMSGYAYEWHGVYRAGASGPLTGKDDLWDTVLIDAEPAHILGRRKIDGADCIVVRMKNGKIYAQTAVALGKGR